LVMESHELTWIILRKKKVEDPFPVVNGDSNDYGIERDVLEKCLRNAATTEGQLAYTYFVEWVR
jgi:hypothetical protein